MRKLASMELYLLRHGIAEDESPTGKDFDRRLTDEGRRKLREVLKAVAKSGVRPDTVLTSPYVRARQTAEIAKDLLAYKDEILLTDSLVPESDPQSVWQEIRTVYGGSRSVVLASHEPLMSRTLGYFLGAQGLLVDFKKGAIARVDIEQFGLEPRGLLKWLLVPKLAGA